MADIDKLFDRDRIRRLFASEEEDRMRQRRIEIRIKEILRNVDELPDGYRAEDYEA